MYAVLHHHRCTARSHSHNTQQSFLHSGNGRAHILFGGAPVDHTHAHGVLAAPGGAAEEGAARGVDRIQHRRGALVVRIGREGVDVRGVDEAH